MPKYKIEFEQYEREMKGILYKNIMGVWFNIDDMKHPGDSDYVRNKIVEMLKEKTKLAREPNKKTEKHHKPSYFEID